MTKLFDQDGNEVEAIVAEELEAKLEEARTAALEAYKTEHPDLSEDLGSLKQQLADKEAELAKLQDKDNNFSKVKEKSEAEKQAYEEQINTLKEELTGIKTTMTNNYKNEIVKQLADGNPELAAKIEHEYSQFAGEAVTNEDISERVMKAYRNANPETQASTLSQALSSVGSRNADKAGQDADVSSVDPALKQALGVSDQDIAQYGKTQQ